MNLQGKNVLITGAARRIGKAIALCLAARGARILLHYHQSQKEAVRLRDEIESLGGEALLFKAGFSGGPKTLPAVKKFAAEIYKKAGRVDVLVNNASIYYPTPLGKITEKDWDNFLGINLKVPFFLSQEIGIRMVKQKSGKIINLVDWMALRPSENYLPYCISKAGLAAATKGLAKALAPHVQVVSIAPGPILPPPGITATRKNKVIARTPLKKFGTPEDIAAAVRFVVEDTDYITGAFIPVDGGNLIA